MQGSQKHRKSGLGRGIEALLGEEDVSRTIRGASKRDVSAAGGLPSSPLKEVDIRLVAPNPQQPRKHFSAQELSELASSIRRDGVLQPIVVTKQRNVYYVVAGERRLRAAKEAGLSTVPVLIKKGVSDRDRLRLALVENIQRSNLNIFEEALAYKSLMENFALSQSECGELVGKNRSTVANAIRMLDLPAPLHNDIVSGVISTGHARALLSLPTADQQLEVADLVKERKMTVRDTEDMCRGKKNQKRAPYKRRGVSGAAVDPNIQRMADHLRESLATKVKIAGSSEKGIIELHYYSAEELQRLVGCMGVNFEL
ncbi:MAG: ParB/RepB/Spo0J family partition protein [Proteobacteria bacterium]|nr:ParB/RepB/Spo0J family partition protein [Pseudomonadota bacterium]